MNRKERRRQRKQDKRTDRQPDPDRQLANAARLCQSGHPEQALDCCRQVLAVRPSDIKALTLAAMSHFKLHDRAQGLTCLRKVTDLAPDDPQAHYNLGTALAQDGLIDEAIGCQNRAIALKPDYPESHYNLANALRQLGSIELAVAGYQRALALAPQLPGVATNLASALLEQGSAAAAMAACEHALRFAPGDRDALAFGAVAATETGDPERAARILGLEHLVQSRDFAAPDGYDDLKQFNHDLANHVMNHPTLTREPHNTATRGGQQTGNLAVEPKGPIRQLEQMVVSAFDRYLPDIKKREGHPYPPLIPVLRKIDVWGTVLESQGHQAAHMHRAAWISGVYYVQLPDIMSESNEDKSGWIEFGRPPDQFRCTANHMVRLLQPVEGRMFLFPSFVYHRTLPFESTERRISIAFDLLA